MSLPPTPREDALKRNVEHRNCKPVSTCCTITVFGSVSYRTERGFSLPAAFDGAERKTLPPLARLSYMDRAVRKKNPQVTAVEAEEAIKFSDLLSCAGDLRCEPTITRFDVSFLKRASLHE